MRRIIFALTFLFIFSCYNKRDPEHDAPNSKRTQVKKEPDKKDPSSSDNKNPKKTDDSEPDDEEFDFTNKEYSLDHVHTASEKMLTRFEDLKIQNVKITQLKTWKNERFIFSKLEYVVEGEPKKFLFSTCHFHKKNIGCHIQTKGGPDEPK